MEKQGCESRIYLAPMEGITTYIFRNAIAKYYGGIDRYYTPFLTASHLKGREKRDVLPENNEGLDVVPQILTNDADLFLEIARQLAELGYSEVNLNLGCPSGTVVSKGRGAGFLDRVEDLDRFLDKVFHGIVNITPAGNGSESNAMTVSIKTRLGMEFLSEWDDILRVYIKYPIKELIVHPRLRNEFYSGEPHIDKYVRAVEYMAKYETRYKNHIPLCYNGNITDIESYDDTLCKLRDTGSAYYNQYANYYDSYDTHSNQEDNKQSIMIGRGLIMNPNLARAIKYHEEHPEQDSSDIAGLEWDKTFKAFITEIMENYREEMSGDKQVVMKMKELWTYFAPGLGLDRKLLKEIHKSRNLDEYKNALSMIM